MGFFRKNRFSRRFPAVRFYNPKLIEVQDNVEIGVGTRVGSFTLIQQGVRIGRNCTIGSHCNIAADVEIGDRVSIQTGCHITKGVRIGSDCFIGPGVITMNSKFMDGHLQAPVIGKNSRVGGGSCILPAVKVGDDVFVGSGAIVTKDIPDGGKVRGNPARPF